MLIVNMQGAISENIAINSVAYLLEETKEWRLCGVPFRAISALANVLVLMERS